MLELAKILARDSLKQSLNRPTARKAVRPLLKTALTVWQQDSNQIDALIDSLLPTAPAESVVVAVYGDGNVKTALADTTGAARAQGALGVVRSTCKLDFTVQLNVAATSDTILNGHGIALLAPATGGALKAGLIDVRIRDGPNLPLGLGTFGIHLYGSVSTSNWSSEVPDTTDVFETIQVSSVGIGLALSKQVLRQDLGGAFIGVTSELGASYRGLYGDIVAERSDSFRVRVLGSPSTHFVGLDAGFDIQFNQLRGALHFYYFPHTQIPGLGKGQVVAGFALQGNLLSSRTLREP
jgi:hypothetical protein